MDAEGRRRAGDGVKLQVALDELIPAREAARNLPAAIERLERGDVDALIIMRRSEPRAVLLTVERYEDLCSRMRVTSGSITALEHNHPKGTVCGSDCPRSFEQVAS
jgi:hypothetical protein